MNATDETCDETTQRNGPDWDAFLKRYRITAIEGTGSPYTVVSASGARYTVRSDAYIPRDCGSIAFRWSCDCPARKRCRHIDAVEQMRWSEAAAAGDYDAMDAMDREEFE